MFAADETGRAEYRPIARPYPGLRPFRADEQPIFFGRKVQTREILDKLEQTHFAVVVGGSGSGKSSLLRAGVIPELKAKGIADSGDFWLVADFTPMDRPLDNLAKAVAKVINSTSKSIGDHVAQIKKSILESNSLGAVLEQHRSSLVLDQDQAEDARGIANLLIICDQFEEIFRRENDAEAHLQAGILVDLIIEAYESRAEYPRLYFIIGMRSDDLHRSAAYVRLPNVINAASYLTRRLAQVEIAEAIINPMRFMLRSLNRQNQAKPPAYRPIAVDSSPFEPALMRVLYEEVAAIAYDPDHLPLLQHLLSVLWENIQKHGTASRTSQDEFQITCADLAQVLGFETVDDMMHRHAKNTGSLLALGLDTQASAALEKNPDCKAVAEIMFRLLGSQDDKGSYKRRWTTRKEIADVATVALPNRTGIASDINKIIAAFTHPFPFLNVTGSTETSKIDVSHEAFIREWATFGKWLADERNLAASFVDLKRQYLEWRSQIVDHSSSSLRRLWTRCFARLSDERLKSLQGWWNDRRDNTAWAKRYAFANLDQNEDGSSLSRISAEHEPSLLDLRRFRQRSNRLRLSRRSVPWVAAGIILIGIIPFFLYTNQVTRTNWERTYEIAVAAERHSQSYTQESSHRDRLWEALIAIESFNALDRERRNPPLLKKLGAWFSHGDSTGLYSQVVARAARASYASMIWPHPGPVSAQDDVEPNYNTNIPALCGAGFKNVEAKSLDEFEARTFGATPKSIIHQTLAPQEKPDGARIALVTTNPDRGLHLVTIQIVAPENGGAPFCQIEHIIRISLPLTDPADAVIDPQLRFILVNFDLAALGLNRQAEQPVKKIAYLMRLRWVRDCRGQVLKDGTCTGTTFAYDGDSTVLTITEGAPYTATQSGLLRDSEHQFWNVFWQDKPELLGVQQAYAVKRPKSVLWPDKPLSRSARDTSARAPVNTGRANNDNSGASEVEPATDLICTWSPTHAAILVRNKKAPRLSYTLRVFERAQNPFFEKLDADCRSPSSDGPAATAVDNFLAGEIDSKLLEIDFVAPTLDGISFDPKHPGYVVLFGAEAGVAYRVPWDSNIYRRDLCAVLRPNPTEHLDRREDGLPKPMWRYSAELEKIANGAGNIIRDLPMCGEDK
jgi:energy-coupling factor transporter ATP-binding protein EcfA2